MLTLVTPCHLADRPSRQRNFRVLHAELSCVIEDLGIEWIVVETEGRKFADLPNVTHVESVGPFNKSRYMNCGWPRASFSTVCMLDADVVMRPEDWRVAFDRMLRHDYFTPYSRISYLGQAMTDAIVNEDFLINWDVVNTAVAPTIFSGGIVSTRKDTLRLIAGWDERFVRWGGEDNAMHRLVRQIHKPTMGNATAYHLWHMAKHRKKSPARRKLRSLYNGKSLGEIVNAKIEALEKSGSPAYEVCCV